MSAEDRGFRAGYVALIGRPNVGKSTLLNTLLGQKLSITSHKPQTTRHRLLGIKTTDSAQFLFVDTPGLHAGAKRAMNRYMNRMASKALADVDVVVFVVEALRWTEEDDLVLKAVRAAGAPVILAVNKVDRIGDKQSLLPYLQSVADKFEFDEVIPVSAYKGTNLEVLEQALFERLPPGERLFDEDQITDRSERFLAAEIVREKLMRRLAQEVPYGTTVEIEQFKEEGELLRIGAIIWVERPNQKPIVIGRGGAGLKEIGREARVDMEHLFGHKVFLQLWVKVKEGWVDDERALNSLGYRDDGE